jgi:hypothetical protein
MVRYLGNSAPQVIGTNFENTQSNLRLKFDQSNIAFQYRTTENGDWLYDADTNYTYLRTFDSGGMHIRRVEEMGFNDPASKVTSTLMYATAFASPLLVYGGLGKITSGGQGLGIGLSSTAEVTSGVVNQDSSTVTLDVDLTAGTLWYYSNVIGSNLLDIKIFGQYIKNSNEDQKSVGGATANQSHLFKCFIQQFWANNTLTWAALGGNVYASLSTDATNFPAGAINAAKVQVISNASVGTILRLTNRTSPASSSVTYWAYSIGNLRN